MKERQLSSGHVQHNCSKNPYKNTLEGVRISQVSATMFQLLTYCQKTAALKRLTSPECKFIF